MPTGTRIRTDNVLGTVTDNPLLVGATTINSAGLANLAAVASNHAILVLDPLRSAGAPEIVIVTAHTAAATSATITRGAYGTTARQHLTGVLWVHAPTTEDVIRIVTSSTRPSDPYQGQLVYETDTDSYVGRGAGSVWQTLVPLGAWTAYTPTLTNLTLGNGALSAGYQRVGRMVTFRVKFTLGSTSAVGTSPQFTLPATAHADWAINMPIGVSTLLDAAVQVYAAIPIMISTTTFAVCAVTTSSATGTTLSVTATVPFTWGTGDVLMTVGTYEAAS